MPKDVLNDKLVVTGSVSGDGLTNLNDEVTARNVIFGEPRFVARAILEKWSGEGKGNRLGEHDALKIHWEGRETLEWLFWIRATGREVDE
jgi:hypothetical protein